MSAQPGHASLFDFVEHGLLRALDAALAEHLAATASPAQRLAIALTSWQAGRGHTCLPLAALAQDPTQLLGWHEIETRPARTEAPARLLVLVQVLELADLQADGHYIGTGPGGSPLVLERGRLYLRRAWQDECDIAATLQARMAASPLIAPARVRAALDAVFPADGAASDLQPNPQPDWQRVACALAARGRFAVITGGPGTGKTTTVARLLRLLHKLEGDALSIALAAPTGKAANRLGASLAQALAGLPDFDAAALPRAQTLHRLLGMRPQGAGGNDRVEPLPYSLLVVDEASMVDQAMMARLCRALRPDARLVLLGDKDQLASVEAGAVLGELCARAQAAPYGEACREWLAAASGEALPAPAIDARTLDEHVAMLRTSHRFDAARGIGRLASALRSGEDAAIEASFATDANTQLSRSRIDAADFRALDALIAHAAAPGERAGYGSYLRLLAAGPGADFAHWTAELLRAFDRFRLLTALRGGDFGVAGLNARAEQVLARVGLLAPEGLWYPGRPVMVTRNDPGLNLSNGDIGIVVTDPQGRRRVCFNTGEGVRSVSPALLGEVETAFALTVHKSQGSEFEHTALVLPETQTLPLARELAYTAVTRSREHFSLFAPDPLTALCGLQPTEREGLLGLRLQAD
ncbi:exodeoxyribonuclease V subunit alpha [Niveibacterium sp. SC-1]|uniref:exodeoxyribonuclease V subunit alpha n=1 Tax=Niveibacterium sp. SC-1 TaxID=3135646 RepID=UPI0031202F00